jgi:large-conductance mechanosensitive channel
MIGESWRSLRELVLKGDLFTIAAALLVALASFYFLQALVEGLVGPAFAAIVNEPGLYSLSFTINEAEFGYGSVLTSLILLALAVVVVLLLAKARQSAESRSTDA